MSIPNIIMAIDGYSSTGKSTFAKRIAEEYSFLYLDSGAVYRAVTLYALDKMIIAGGTIDEAALLSSMPEINIRYDADLRLLLQGHPVGNEIRSMEVSEYVSPVSAFPFVRDFVNEKLRELGKNGRVVLDGRDIGTTVFPEAGLKIFMIATEEIRARRRYEEMKSKGSDVDFEKVLKNIRDRDYMDSHRKISPLAMASDAIILDNSYLTIEDQILWLKCVIRNKFSL